MQKHVEACRSHTVKKRSEGNTSLKKEDRQALHGNHSFVIWFTGLSCSGKSTIANALEHRLFKEKKHTYLLDGDLIRSGLNRDLGFGQQDRNENIRRIGEVAKLFVDAGIIVFVAAISPYRTERAGVRSLFQPGQFIEVYIHCSLEECEKRDPKGLYRKARAGEIPNFTGISAPYEYPENPEVTLHTEDCSIDESVEQVLAYLKSKSLT